MDIRDKYNTRSAIDYRDILAAEAESREYVPRDHEAAAAAAALAQQQQQARSGAAGLNSAASKNSNEEYFASLGSRNSARPDHLPPSQGGRYGGFGSSYSSAGPRNGGTSSSNWLSGSGSGFEDAASAGIKSLSSGWSTFSSWAASTTKTMQQQMEEKGINKQFEDFGRRLHEGATVGMDRLSRLAEEQGISLPQSGRAPTNATTGDPRTSSSLLYSQEDEEEPRSLDPDREQAAYNKSWRNDW